MQLYLEIVCDIEEKMTGLHVRYKDW